MLEQRTSLPYDRIIEEAKSVPRTDHRNFKVYKDLFGFSDNELEGKSVLDIGAADSRFAEESAGITRRVVRLDLKFSDIPPEYRNGAITGAVQDLPFADNSFDETLSAISLYWINTGLKEALLEMIRVTKPEGKIRIFPAALKEGEMAQYSPSTRLIYVSRHRSLSPTLVITKDSSYTSNDWKNEVSNILACVDI